MGELLRSVEDLERFGGEGGEEAQDSSEATGIQHECGVTGVFGGEAAGRRTVNMLQLLQHRGELSAGVGGYGQDSRALIVRDGHVDQAFADVLHSELPNELDMQLGTANVVIGHVRWSTSGDSKWGQPFQGTENDYFLAQNGEISNIDRVVAAYSITPESGESDTSLVNKIFDREYTDRGDILQATEAVTKQLEGGFAFVICTDNILVAVRDPWATRPLSIGYYSDGSVQLASESIALGGADHVEEVPGNTIVVVDKSGVAYKNILPQAEEKACVFEWIYFMHKDSIANGRPVEAARYDAGFILAQEELERMKKSGIPEALWPKPDGVIGVPRSAIPGAEGFAAGMNAPFYKDALRKASKERSYVQDTQEKREAVVENIEIDEEFLEWVAGKVIYVIDDSIVNGTTMHNLVARLKAAGAQEVLVRITAPDIKDECFSGANIRKGFPGLLASRFTIREIADYISADSLAYLSEEGLAQAIGKPLGALCMTCITSDTHLDLPRRKDKTTPPRNMVWRHDLVGSNA